MEKEKNSRSKTILEKILNNRAYPAIFLVIIVLVSVSLAMVIGNITRVKIIAGREAEIVNQLNVIFPDMQEYKIIDDYYVIYQDKEVAGYAFTATGKGYGGDINMLIGIDRDYHIQELAILSNTETPGLGTKITESYFTDQFKGLGSDDINLGKDGGKIDSITGATISSKAVTEAVKKEMELKIDKIKNNK